MKEAMNILLINPPREVPQKANFPPMGLAYIAAVLKKNNIDVEVLDAAAFRWKRLERIIKQRSPDIAGIVCWTIERGQAFKTAQLVRKAAPQAKIIVGGQHATALPEHMFRLAYADAVVIGEGELTTLELVKTFYNNGDLSEIKGIAYQKNGETFITPPRDLITNLDSIPFPSYTDFNLDDYNGLPERSERSAALMTSRGCPYRCIYCSGPNFWRRKWRYRSAENVLDEIEWLYNDYDVRAFIFFDDNFAVRKDRAIAICDGILRRGLKISWRACTRVDLVNKELLKWMKKAGCYGIDYGIESGSPKILERIRKGQTVKQIKEALRLTHEAGIRPRAYLMVGNPGENEETIQETITLLNEMKPYNTPSGQILWILPGTEIYELAKSQGVISDDFWVTNHSVLYYTGEHSVEELKALRNQLMLGLAKNRGNIQALLEYYIRRIYYNSAAAQKIYHSYLAKLSWLFRFFKG